MSRDIPADLDGLDGRAFQKIVECRDDHAASPICTDRETANFHAILVRPVANFRNPVQQFDKPFALVKSPIGIRETARRYRLSEAEMAGHDQPPEEARDMRCEHDVMAQLPCHLGFMNMASERIGHQIVGQRLGIIAA